MLKMDCMAYQLTVRVDVIPIRVSIMEHAMNAMMDTRAIVDLVPSKGLFVLMVRNSFFCLLFAFGFELI